MRKFTVEFEKVKRLNVTIANESFNFIVTSIDIIEECLFFDLKITINEENHFSGNAISLNRVKRLDIKDIDDYTNNYRCIYSH